MADALSRLNMALRDRYRLEREIGRGGMAVVYLAEDLRHHRRVAIKVLSPELGPAIGPERFLREIEIAARLTHPNILPLHDSGEADGLLYYVMPFVEGETLRDRLSREHQLPIEDAVRIAREVADALGYAHSMGLVHRDIKPENILFQAGHAVVSDFGIARAVSAAGGGITESGVAVGTVLYMSPEQAIGSKDIDARSDVYSLGCVLYEMLTGEAPFGGAVVTERGLDGASSLPGLRAARATVPVRVEQVLAKALARNPADRFVIGGQMADALGQALTGAGSAIPARRRSRARLAVVAALVVLAAAGAWRVRTLRAAPIRSLAVLPVQNLSGDSAQAYFVEGMHDALIAELAGIGSLRVISRTSTMKYRSTSKSVPEIAAELRVDALIEASALRSGDSVRLRVHLIRARPAERDLWAETYAQDLRHIVVLHRSVAQAIARRVSAPLSADEQRRLATTRTVEPEAYDAYLRGMFILHAAENAADFQRGLTYLQQAIARDSTEPLPWAGLALGYDQIGHLSDAIPDAFHRAKEAAARAQALGGDLGETQAALAQTQLYFDWDFAAADETFRRAIALNSSIPDAHAHYGWLLLLRGRTDQALIELRRAEEVDPLTPLWPAFTGSAELWSRHSMTEAMAAVRRSLALNPEFPIALYIQAEIIAYSGRAEDAVAVARRVARQHPWRFYLAWALARAGQREEALRMADDLRRNLGPFGAWGLAQIYAGLGDRDEAMRWLEAAYRAHMNWMPWMDFCPGFEPLRADPRFQDLMRRVGAPRCTVCPTPRASS